MKIKSLWVAMLLGVSALVSAVHEDRPPGATWQAEQSAEALASQQAYQGRIDQSGAVPIRTEDRESAPVSNQKNAAAALSAASRREAAARNLVAAEERTKNPTPSKRSPWWFAILLLGVGIIGFVGAKDWMAKNVPAMPAAGNRRKKKSL